MSAFHTSTPPKSTKNISKTVSPTVMMKSCGAAHSGASACTSDEMNDVSASWKKGTFEIISRWRQSETSRRRWLGRFFMIAVSSKIDWRDQ